jgi:hypothetical protein
VAEAAPEAALADEHTDRTLPTANTLRREPRFATVLRSARQSAGGDTATTTIDAAPALIVLQIHLGA